MPFSTTLGFVTQTFDELFAALIVSYQAESGILVDPLAEGDPVRDMLATMARALVAVEQSQSGTYGSGFVGTSTGAALRNLLFPFIGEPLVATSSTVVLALGGVALTNVPAGSGVTLNTDGPGASQWLLVAPVVLPANGTFAYSATGPKTAAAGSAWTIATPVAGWSTIAVNAADAVLGRVEETELQYRQRFAVAAQARLLVSKVSSISGVTAVSIFENQTDVPDVFWGATHWFELLVVGGADQEIADSIHEYRPVTTQSIGTTTQAVNDAAYPGGVTAERFSRPNAIDVYVAITITKGEGYSLDTSAAAITARETAISDRVVAWGNARTIGLDVTSGQVFGQVITTPSVPGIADLVVFVDVVFPAVSAIVVADVRDQLVFDSTRITIVGA